MYHIIHKNFLHILLNGIDTRHAKSIHSKILGLGFEIVSLNRSALTLFWNLLETTYKIHAASSR